MFVLVAAAVLPLDEATAGTLDRVRQSGKLTLGYRTDARPFSYRDESGKAAGYSVALCERIADQVKTELKLPALALEWVALTLEERLRAVQQGRVDLLCAADAVTLSRRQDVSFSIPIFADGIGALLRSDSPQALREVLSKGQAAPRPFWRASPGQILQRKTFSVVANTTAEKWLAERLGTFRITATVAPVDSYDAGVQRVLNRTSDVMFGNRAILLDAAARNPSARALIVLDRQFTYEPLGLVLQRNDDDFRLVVDRTLSQIFTSKELLPQYTRWFGTPDTNTLTFFHFTALPE